MLNIGAGDQDRSAVGLFEPCYQAQRGGFSAS
jgi:hypothetical protein